MTTKKTVIGALLAGLAILAAIAITFSLLVDKRHRHTERDDILHRFNRAEVERLNEMVHRHQQGKGDYLMLIPPIIDGGYWIYDVHSNGRTITWTIDNTRDGMSANHGKQVYRCKTIDVRENSERYVYTVHQCDGEGDKFLPIFTLRKDDIHD